MAFAHPSTESEEQANEVAEPHRTDRSRGADPEIRTTAEGTKLAKACNELLNAAELRISRLQTSVGEQMRFIDGDSNDDEEVDISDAIATFGVLFLGQGVSRITENFRRFPLRAHSMSMDETYDGMSGRTNRRLRSGRRQAGHLPQLQGGCRQRVALYPRLAR